MQDFKHSALFSILRRIALRWFSHFERQNCANLKKHRKDRRYSFRKVLKYVELSKIYYGCVRKPPRSIFSTKPISQSPRYSRIHNLLLSHVSDRCKCTDRRLKSVPSVHLRRVHFCCRNNKACLLLGVREKRGGWWDSSSENRSDGLDFGRFPALQFGSKSRGLPWLSLDEPHQPPRENLENSTPK